jgi:hypothetical protein
MDEAPDDLRHITVCVLKSNFSSFSSSVQYPYSTVTHMTTARTCCHIDI